MEMNFVIDWEFAHRMDGMSGKMTGMEFCSIEDYEEVDKLIAWTQKVLLKKRDGEVTFRCVQFKPDYSSNCLVRIVNSFGSCRVIRWKKGESWGEDETIEKPTAKTMKSLFLEAMQEYKNRKAEAEWEEQNAEYRVNA